MLLLLQIDTWVVVVVGVVGVGEVAWQLPPPPPPVSVTTVGGVWAPEKPPAVFGFFLGLYL